MGKGLRLIDDYPQLFAGQQSEQMALGLKSEHRRSCTLCDSMLGEKDGLAAMRTKGRWTNGQGERTVTRSDRKGRKGDELWFSRGVE
ncbi:hypothetical protein V6N13_064568 [Hibiscus sabdariffa]|uniref:Uncharacterized protein n=1 Tax=Hibiscus sabdariffa TaxID=183260 RepID=A0ABR2EAG8_9ROSI